MRGVDPDLQALMEPSVPKKEQLGFNVAFTIAGLTPERQKMVYRKIADFPSNKEKLHRAREFAREVDDTGRRKRRPSDDVAIFMGFVQRYKTDVDRIVNMPSGVFKSMIENKDPADVDLMLRQLERCSGYIDELISAIRHTQKQ